MRSRSRSSLIGRIAAAAALLAAGCSKAEDPTLSASTGPAEQAAPEAASSPRTPANPEGASPQAAVSQGVSEPAVASLPASIPASLSGRLDCLRQSGGILLIGHRGGPTRDYPENAIETLERTFKAGTRGAEIDIAQSKDGVLFLMHDDDLARTSTGTGLASDHSWADISKLNLETYSKATGFHPAKLADALAWAVKTGAVLELDKKKTASWQPIIAEVRTARAENNVFLITYTDEQAIEVHKQAPDLVITATIDGAGRLDQLLKGGVNAEHLIAWTGTSEPDPALWKALGQRGIESAFGTLGPRSSSLDGKYWQDDDGSEYDALVSGGLPILVTDLTDKVSRQLSVPLSKSKSCGL